MKSTVTIIIIIINDSKASQSWHIVVVVFCDVYKYLGGEVV